MAERIIGAFVCLVSAFPFFALSLQKDSRTPIGFWAGDTTLREKLADVAGYNRAMAAVYRRYSRAFLASGVAVAVYPPAGFALMLASCTVGLWLVWRGYRSALKKYSRSEEK